MLAVMPLTGTEVPASVTQVMTDMVVVYVSQIGTYDVISTADIETLLGFEKMKDVMGCNDLACAADLGGSLGAELMLTGNLGMSGNIMTIKLSLFDNVNMKIVSRALKTVENDPTLFPIVLQASLNELFGVKGSGAQGGVSQLVVVPIASSPIGAAVVIDGRVVPVSSLAFARV